VYCKKEGEQPSGKTIGVGNRSLGGKKELRKLLRQRRERKRGKKNSQSNNAADMGGGRWHRPRRSIQGGCQDQYTEAIQKKNEEAEKKAWQSLLRQTGRLGTENVDRKRHRRSPGSSQEDLMGTTADKKKETKADQARLGGVHPNIREPRMDSWKELTLVHLESTPLHEKERKNGCEKRARRKERKQSARKRQGGRGGCHYLWEKRDAPCGLEKVFARASGRQKTKLIRQRVERRVLSLKEGGWEKSPGKNKNPRTDFNLGLLKKGLGWKKKRTRKYAV